MGAQASTSDLCCLNIQKSLEMVSSEDPGRISEDFGFLQALKSTANTRGLEPIVTRAQLPGKGSPQSGAGARPRVELKYLRPVRNTAATTKPGLCADHTDSVDPYEYLDIDLDHTVALARDIIEDDFDDLCETPNERIGLEIELMARDLLRATNVQLITSAYATLGNYADGTTASTGGTARTLNILNPAGYANPAAFGAVKSQFRKMYATDRSPIVVGGDILSTFMDTRVVGGLGSNAVSASDNPAAALHGATVFTDFDVDTTVQGIETDTNSHMIAWTPGNFSLLEWFRYTGYREKFNNPNYTKTTIEALGHTFDFQIKYDECNEVWKLVLSKHYDLFHIPDVAYTGGAAVWPWNRRLHWIAGCGEWDCASYAIGG